MINKFFKILGIVFLSFIEFFVVIFVARMIICGSEFSGCLGGSENQFNWTVVIILFLLYLINILWIIKIKTHGKK
jgi:hypothetical protein